VISKKLGRVPALITAAATVPAVLLGTQAAGGAATSGCLTTFQGPYASSPNPGELLVTGISANWARTYTVTATRANLSQTLTAKQNTGANQKLLITWNGLKQGTTWNVQIIGSDGYAPDGEHCAMLVTSGQAKIMSSVSTK
jgi:hypothetical protein